VNLWIIWIKSKTSKILLNMAIAWTEELQLLCSSCDVGSPLNLVVASLDNVLMTVFLAWYLECFSCFADHMMWVHPSTLLLHL